MENLIGTLGVALALTGGLLTAIPNSRIARFGFAAYVAADFPLFIYSVSRGEGKLALMYAGFVIFAGLGLYLRSIAGTALYDRVSKAIQGRMRMETPNPNSAPSLD